MSARVQIVSSTLISCLIFDFNFHQTSPECVRLSKSIWCQQHKGVTFLSLLSFFFFFFFEFQRNMGSFFVCRYAITKPKNTHGYSIEFSISIIAFDCAATMARSKAYDDEGKRIFFTLSDASWEWIVFALESAVWDPHYGLRKKRRDLLFIRTLDWISHYKYMNWGKWYKND